MDRFPFFAMNLEYDWLIHLEPGKQECACVFVGVGVRDNYYRQSIIILYSASFLRDPHFDKHHASCSVSCESDFVAYMIHRRKSSNFADITIFFTKVA